MTLEVGLSLDDLGHLIFYSAQIELRDEINLIYFFRLLWLKANLFLYQGETDISIRTLELVSMIMSQIIYCVLRMRSGLFGWCGTYVTLNERIEDMIL